MQKIKHPLFKYLISLHFELKRILLQLKYPNLTIAPGVIIQGSFEIRNKVKVTIGSGSRLNKRVVIYGSGELTVGKNVSINGACIGCETSIQINDYCLISDCFLSDSDYHNLEPHLRHSPPTSKVAAPITLKHNVWIGARVTIMKGVTVGKNSVIGLGSIIRKSVPDNVVVIGNPQQIVKKLTQDSAEPYKQKFHEKAKQNHLDLV
ncbi:MAG: acyltransferase [Cyanobacteria bacterium J06621_15]